MSVEDTLAERGKRYGDFTDHAEICQRIKLAMIAGSARWTRLSDVQKQALEVIADKIARILSGDPNYADNWHDIQGYAKLVEDRLPSSTPAQPRPFGMNPALGAGYELTARCDECGTVSRGGKMHYATCSKLTAPKEFVAEVEATFHGLENAASSAADQLMDKVGAEIVESIAVGTFVEDPFAGAPEWAKYKAQDEDGDWFWYSHRPKHGGTMWEKTADCESCERESIGFSSVANWRDTLIERP